MPPLPRVVTAEILDTLSTTDPRARRSRWDLRIVDLFMGNSRWIIRRTLRAPHQTQVIEIGAGDGRLCALLRKLRPDLRITGLDLAERPGNLDAEIDWKQGDFFKTLPDFRGGICIGSLVLHHFKNSELAQLGERLSQFDRLFFCEPLRSQLPLWMSMFASPFAGEVTRHDMPASIRAGFQPGELSALLKLDPSRWVFRESINWRGALRFEAEKRDPIIPSGPSH